jgi:Leucine-rich repeat (LRR) protein
VLDLRGNRLDELPEALGDLPALEKLDLRWNRFARLPGAAARLAGRGAVVLS